MKCLVKVTFNGQLGLLMLIEDLEYAGFHCVSANTDGIVAQILKDREKEYYLLCDIWAKKLKMTVSYNDYELLVQKDVNAYMAVYTDGEVKQKGRFKTDINIDGGYNAPVIAKAINAYYRYGTGIRRFIEQHEEVHDFVISQKTGRQFVIESHYIDYSKVTIDKLKEVVDNRNSKNPYQSDSVINIGDIMDTHEHKVDILQKNNRYLVTNTGGTLMKKYKDKNKRINLVGGWRTTIFNDFYYVDKFKDYDINYNYYVSETMKVINKIDGKLTSDMLKISGTLFDELN